MARTTVSAGIVNSEPGTGSGRRRPDSSGSPRRMRWHSAAVHAGDALRAQAHGGADAVHGRIAAADDEDVPAERQGLPHLLRELVRLQVAAHQEFGGLVDAGQLLAGDAHLAADAGAGADEDGVVAT